MDLWHGNVGGIVTTGTPKWSFFISEIGINSTLELPKTWTVIENSDLLTMNCGTILCQWLIADGHLI